MENDVKLCMGCMNPVKGSVSRCPICGYDGSSANSDMTLKVGAKLKNGRYVVGRQTESDSESITYIGYDNYKKRRVMVREFFLADGCSRKDDEPLLVPKSDAEVRFKTSKEDFCALYKGLWSIKNAHGLIKILDVFDENGTSYAVLEYFDGVTLKAFLKMRGGAIPADRCISLMRPVISAAEAIHAAGLIHRGISTETIFVDRNGAVKLAGFASPAVRTAGTDINAKLFTGYSAPEQYSTTGYQSASTDVYALGAVIYRCITGEKPQEAIQRKSYDHMASPTELSEDIPAAVSKAVTLAMLVNPSERTKTPQELQAMLDGDYEPSRDDEQESGEAASLAGEKRANIVKYAAVLSAMLLALSLLVYFVTKSEYEKRAAEEARQAGEALAASQPEKTEDSVPSYVGDTLEAAQEKFSDSFRYRIEYTYVEGKGEGVVVKQSPSANTVAAVGSEVVLYLNQYAIIEMIDLWGLTKENAEIMLYSLLEENSPHKFKINYNAQPNSEFPEGTVIWQSVEVGESFDVDRQMLTLTLAMPEDTEDGEEDDD